MRAIAPRLASAGTIQRVNSDNTYSLHFLPAISVRADGDLHRLGRPPALQPRVHQNRLLRAELGRGFLDRAGSGDGMKGLETARVEHARNRTRTLKSDPWIFACPSRSRGP